MTEPDLQLLLRQNERIMNDVAALRDDMRVLTAIVLRLEGGQSALASMVDRIGPAR
jgi:hypothetical protein